MELVSVIIPCHNDGEFLSEAIDSALAQSYGQCEVIVVDDGSTDNTPDVARRYPEVTYIYQTCSGVSAARNSGIAHSSGDFLVFLDADDRLLPDHFKKNLECFHTTPELGMVCGDYRWFGEHVEFHVHDCHQDPDYYASLLKTNFIGPPSVIMVRRQVIEEINGFRQFKGGEDVDLYLRIAQRYPMHCHCHLISEYRRRPNQTSRNNRLMLSELLRMLHSHWDYAKSNEAYVKAYREGVALRKEGYGGAMINEVADQIDHRQWRAAIGGLLVLLQLYPAGLYRAIRNKLGRLT